jgi:predicted nucleic acid-binding protein
MKRTYVDANVLIAAFQGDEDTSRRAMEVLDDPRRKLVISGYLRLEVLPKPSFHRRQDEVEFMNTILENAAENIPSNPDLTTSAINLASRYDLTPIDALHAGAAVTAGVDGLVTMEKPTKPLCRVTEVKVVSLHSSAMGSR